MITSIRIENFRGIRSGELTEMKPLTILTGTNGCGKSAVLDALLIAASPSPGDAVGRAVQRHPISKDGARWLVRQHAQAANVALRFDGDGGERRLRLTVSLPRVTIEHLHRGQPVPETIVAFDGDRYEVEEDDVFRPRKRDAVTTDAERVQEIERASTMSTHEIEVGLRDWITAPQEVKLSDPGIPVALNTAYSEAKKQGRKKDVLELLRSIVPDVEDLEILEDSKDTYSLYLTKAGGAVPVSLSGDGIQSFLQLALEIAAMPGGLVLVEEPEVYQHPAAIEKTAQVLRESARRGVQTVITTHSLELIDCLVNDADEQARADTALYILKLSDGELRTSRFAGESLRSARVDAEMDLR